MHGLARCGWARLAFAVALGAIIASAGVVLAPRTAVAATRSALRNVSPTPWFWEDCDDGGPSSSGCVQEAVAAIEHARADEQLPRPAVVLPEDFQSLSVPEQTFVIIDLERVDRGLRPLAGLVPELDHAVRSAAVEQADPTPSLAQLRGLGADRYRTLWASTLGPLVSDYEWMYDDGYSGSHGFNVDCRTPQAPGCWDHRRNILAKFAGEQSLYAGIAEAPQPNGVVSITAILVAGNGAAPHYSYTWRDALDHGADAN